MTDINHVLGNVIQKVSWPEEQHDLVHQRLHFPIREDDHPRVALRVVGWYCGGGHLVVHEFKVIGSIAPPNLRFDDPCEHGVPVFVVEQ